MYDNSQFRTFIIRPSLQAMSLYTADAEELLIAILAHESLGGRYLRQESSSGKSSVARGPYQMEPQTHNDLWAEHINNHADIVNKFTSFCPYARNPSPDWMINDLFYSTIMARIFFLRVKEAIPPANNIEAIAQYWKTYWNTSAGAGEVQSFIKNYHNFIKGGV